MLCNISRPSKLHATHNLNARHCCSCAAAAAAAAASAAGQGSDPITSEEQQHIQRLEARAADLRERLCQQNSLIKQVIDKLRHLVDAFNMWDSHERHLVQNSVQYAVAGTGAI
jgi:hypothetical protein